jgi:lysozyme
MNCSRNCLDLVAEFEGLRLEAYLDPVGIPTIGYGTIRYPDGRKVQLGESITEREAEAFLTFECNNVGKEVTALVKVPLNQNQFDALVSFCYNAGLGAFTDSTLLRKLNASDFPGAVAEFLKWNKGTIKGVKQELRGLTRRRTKEKELFERGGGGGAPIQVEESPREKVNLLEGFRDGENNVIVAWNDDQVVEIVTLDSAIKDHVIAVLQQYPHAGSFRIAPSGKAIPSGERIPFTTRDSTIPTVQNPPRLDRVLVRGMEGEDVKRLQERLQDLGYYSGSIDGDFGRRTDAGVKEFQAKVFGVAEADGKVGQKTWGKLWGDATPVPTPPTGPVIPGRHYLRLTKTHQRDEVGCNVLNLEYFKDGQVKGSLGVCSGAPSKQFFRTGRDSISGSFEPLPEGRWILHDIEWADGSDNYNGKVWNNGLGPAKIRMDYKEPGTTRRSAIEIHIDWNRRNERGAGTAGCIGIHNVADFKFLVGWLRETDPRDLFVDWGLGTCPQPK